MPYKQRVRGSNPCAPTLKNKRLRFFVVTSCFLCTNNLQTTRRFTVLFPVCLLDNFIPSIYD